jgi:hypothetical protein
MAELLDQPAELALHAQGSLAPLSLDSLLEKTIQFNSLFDLGIKRLTSYRNVKLYSGIIPTIPKLFSTFF